MEDIRSKFKKIRNEENNSVPFIINDILYRPNTTRIFPSFISLAVHHNRHNILIETKNGLKPFSELKEDSIQLTSSYKSNAELLKNENEIEKVIVHLLTILYFKAKAIGCSYIDVPGELKLSYIAGKVNFKLETVGYKLFEEHISTKHSKITLKNENMKSIIIETSKKNGEKIYIIEKDS
jgi:hypothetical protein